MALPPDIYLCNKNINERGSLPSSSIKASRLKLCQWNLSIMKPGHAGLFEGLNWKNTAAGMECGREEGCCNGCVVLLKY
jgi:hypothetical protein